MPIPVSAEVQQIVQAFCNERRLAGVAASLVGDASITQLEWELPKEAPQREDRQIIESIRAAVAAGEDPLGEAFCRFRSLKHRRALGAVYTPRPIVDSMVAWAASEGPIERVVDPGCGSGRFLLAAARQFRNASLIAIEVDPLAALILRANLALSGHAARARVIVDDYRSVELLPIKGSTLFIGNPPYVRHHDLSPEGKTWLAASAARAGIKASKLAGLHVHFFFKTAELARARDIGAFVTSAEWLDVNYGEALRRLLANGLGGTSLHILDAKSAPFTGVAATAAITCFRVGRRPANLTVRAVPAADQIGDLSKGQKVSWDSVVTTPRWSRLIRPATPAPTGYIELGELCRVSRGQVTGNNAIWIEGAHTKALPATLLAPTITKARELLKAGERMDDSGRLRRVVNLPADLDLLEPAERVVVEAFLRWARSNGAESGYIARHRRAWWAVSLYEPAPIVCTYMARQPPAFVRNICAARHLNIAHGLYPRQPLQEAEFMGLVRYLRANVPMTRGRTYAGGLVKFEPKELERIPIPGLEALQYEVTANLDGKAA